MNIVIIGAGGIGGYLASMLGAFHGRHHAHEAHGSSRRLHCVARGAHGRHIQRHGLTLTHEGTEARADRRCRALTASPSMPSFHPDIVLFCVKMTDYESACALLRALKRPTLVLPLQNGVEVTSLLTRDVPHHRIGMGVAHISSFVKEAGVICLNGNLARFSFAVSDKKDEALLDAFIAYGKEASIQCRQVPKDVMARMLWDKFIFLTTFSGLTTLTQQPLGVLRSHPPTWRLFEEGLDEGERVARAYGISFPESPKVTWMKTASSLPASYRASMSLDRERGRPLELPWLSGGLARLAEKKTIPVPIHRMITALLSL